MFDLEDDDDIPEKLFQIKIYFRVSPEGDYQVVRMEPMVTADNTFVAGMVRIYVDEQPAPTILTRDAAYAMLNNTNCVPVEEVMRHKHLMRN